MILSAATYVLFSGLLLQGNSTPATQLRVYPLTTDCTTTLQACVDAANSGDIIDIATNVPIDEDVSIANKSIVLRGAPGFSPVIGGANELRTLSVFVGILGSGRSVTIENLNLINTSVIAGLSVGSDHTFVLRDSNIMIDIGDTQSRSVFVRFEGADGQSIIEGNRISGPGDGIEVQIRDNSIVSASIQRNWITSGTPDVSANGILVDSIDGTNTTVNVFSNVVYGTGGYNFLAGGIFLVARSEVTASFSHNTIHSLQGISAGILIQGAGVQADVNATVYNNSVSAVNSNGFMVSRFDGATIVPTLEGNNSYGNALDDFILGESVSGIPLNADPEFVDPDSGNFRLRPSSPLIDAAQDQPDQGSFSTDAAGNARPEGVGSDVGALEAGAGPVLFFSSLDEFSSAPEGVLASGPYPGPFNGPPEPFVSGQISLEAVAPSSLFFDDWIPDDPGRGQVGPGPVNELALNDAENLIIRSLTGPVFGMGIEFFDAAGGESPSTFTLTAWLGNVPVGQATFRTPRNPPRDFVGLWSPVEFDALEITELPIANENEFFGQVYTSAKKAFLTIFSDGFEP